MFRLCPPAFLRAQSPAAKLSWPCPVDHYRAWCSCYRFSYWVLDQSSEGRYVTLSFDMNAVDSALTKFPDLIAALGEATATPYFIYRLRDAMLSDPTGRRILRDRPRITSETLQMSYLRTLPENSVGRTYAKWLDREGVSPDTRDQVQYIDDEECAYVMQRYRECHDFYHAVTGLPIFVEGELALKALEFLNTLLPMTGLSLFAFVRMKPAEKERFLSLHLPWAVRAGLSSKELINVYWEEVLEKDVDELRAELNIEQPPDLREIRKMMRQQQKREKERQQQVSS